MSAQNQHLISASRTSLQHVPRMPWHDVGLSVGGCAARDVALHFISRWNHHRLVLGELKEPSLLPHSDHVQVGVGCVGGVCGVCVGVRRGGGGGGGEARGHESSPQPQPQPQPHVQIANHVPPALMSTMTSGRNLGR